MERALNAVASTVFPHRALEIQKLWMNRRMFKPVELTTRQTSAAINRLNNSLPLFPGGSETLKFTEIEIVGLLEWSLPPASRPSYGPARSTKTLSRNDSPSSIWQSYRTHQAQYYLLTNFQRT